MGIGGCVEDGRFVRGAKKYEGFGSRIYGE